MPARSVHVSLIGLCSVAILFFASGCADDPCRGEECEPTRCSPSTCPDGCCEGDLCRAGDAESACGSGGKSCSSCSQGASCEERACVTTVPACDATTCPDGCCDGDTCRGGTTALACGAAGAACASCGEGLCEARQCVTTPVCDATTCPDGCCEGTTCRSGRSDALCGHAGAACLSCDADKQCDATGLCEPKPVCGPLTCSSGCCADGVCVVGTTDTICGGGGETCQTCSSADTCEAHQCRPRPCGPSTCPDGCCDEGQCVAGTANDSCGQGGLSCGSCSAPLSCQAQSCAPPACPSGSTRVGLGPCVCGDLTQRLSLDGTQCEPKLAWTVLVYMNADHDLESFALRDVAEMVAGAPSDDVRVVVQLDRTQGYSAQTLPGVGAFSDTRRFEITSLGAVPVGPFLGEKNSNDRLVLADFVTWGLTNYPSRRSALVVWDHGEAWTGLGVDRDSGGLGMSLARLAEGLDLGLANAGKVSLDLLGFDAGLMANIEVVTQVRRFAEILVASEELEASQGWDYTALVRALRLDPEQSTTEFGERIVDAYIASAIDDGQESTMTLSVIDLAHALALASAVSDVGEHLSQTIFGRASWLTAARALQHSQRYSRGLRDLGGIADWLQFTTTDAALELLMVPLQAAYSRAVVYQLGGTARSGSTGLSVYLPLKSASYNEVLTYGSSGDFAGNTFWRAFLSRYQGEADYDTSAPTIGALTVSREATGLRVQSGVVADDLQSAFVQLYAEVGDQLLLLGSFPLLMGASGGAVDIIYPLSFTVLEHGGETVRVMPSFDFEGWQVAALGNADTFDRYSGEIPIEFAVPGEAWAQGRLTFSVHSDTGAHSLTGIVTEGPFGVANIGLPAGVRIRPKVLVVGPTATTYESSGEITLTTPSSARLLGSALAVNQRVFPTVMVEDIVGNTALVESPALRVRGAACASHTACGATEFCDPVDHDCRPVYGTSFLVSGLTTTVAPVNDEGAEWDEFGGLPDPQVDLYLGEMFVAGTSVLLDTLSATWTESFPITFAATDDLKLYVWDEDATDFDFVGGFAWDDHVGIVRDGGGTVSSPGALRSLSFTVVPQ